MDTTLQHPLFTWYLAIATDNGGGYHKGQQLAIRMTRKAVEIYNYDANSFTMVSIPTAVKTIQTLKERGKRIKANSVPEELFPTEEEKGAN